MAYEDILQKYKSTNEPVETSVPEIKLREIDALKDNPYKSLAEKVKYEKRVADFTAGTKNYEESMKPKGIISEVWDVAKAVPKAAVDMTKFTIQHPVKAERAFRTGLLDIGPVALNTVSWLGRSILDFTFGKDPNQPNIRLPRPSETLAEYLNYERSDEEKALSEGTMQAGGYELGQAPLKILGAGRAVTAIGGDIIGGQLTSESTNPKERATQAIFDGIFGTAQLIGGKLIRSIKEKPKVEVTTPKVDGEVSKTNNDMLGGEVVEVRGGEKPSPDAPERPKTAYVAKEDLGVDERGQKIMATTEVDTKTGDAIVYYRKELDSNTKLRDIVWDFEEPHILDKRLGKTGESFTPNLNNPNGDVSVIERALDTFSKKLNKPIDEIAVQLKNDIDTIAKNNKVITEKFADAYGIYKNKPEFVREKAPTLAKFFEHQLVEPRFSVKNTVENDLMKEIPNYKQVTTPEEIPVDVIGKRLKNVRDVEVYRTKHVPKEIADKRLKAYGMELSAIERKIRGRPTDIELSNAKKFLDSNYSGKKAMVDDKPVTITGKVSFGRHEVVFKNGMNKFVQGSEIKSKKATNQDALAYLNKQGLEQLKGKEQLYGLKVPKDKPIIPIEIKTKKTPEVTTEEVPVIKVEEKPVVKTETVDSKFSKTGLDTGKRVEGKPSVNLDAIDAPADVERLFNKMDAENKNFSSQRISKTNEDLKDLARMTGLTAEELSDLAPGSIANAETLVAARQLVLNKTANLANKLKGINLETATLAQKADVRDTFLELIAMQKSVAGLRTEASNVLRSFGVKLRPGENIAVDELIANMKKLGIEEIDPNDISALTEASGKLAESMNMTLMQKAGQGALQTWYSAILSGPKTTVRNVMSTGANILSEMAIKVIDPRRWNEIIPAYKGFVKGWTESAEAGGLKKILSLEAVDPSTGKFFDTDAVDVDKIFTGKLEKFGRLVEIPGRILNRQDARFRAAAQEMEKAALKVYKPEITEAVSQAISESYGTQVVYRGKPKGKIIEAVTEGALTSLKKAPELRVIMPFVQTVANVIDRQFDYMPIFSVLRLTDSALERQVSVIAKNYGITDEIGKTLIKTRLRDQQIGRMALGMGMTAGALALAKNGNLSGAGPSNYSERVQLQRTGWRPNSIKIGDTWIPYTYLGPLAGILALAGNVHDKVAYDDKPGKDIVDLIGHGITGWMNTQLDNSFLSGVANLVDAVGPGGDPKKYLTQLGANITPLPQAYVQTLDIGKGILSYATGDETFRQQYETRDYISKIRKSLGLTGDIGIADALNPRYDQFGQVMTSDIIWGVTPTVDKRDAMVVDNYLINNDIVVSLPVYSKEYSTPSGEKRKLTATEFNKYVKTSGREIYRTLNDMLPSLENMPQDVAQKRVKEIVSKIREQARNEIFYQD